ncbi:hypothetical protein [Steroidobacter agaridevorans]|uniref:hypothetical protein n=1 Tax=Steroidobacter agaridevorans TaxID=2695856 RepID=UPI00137A2293|nr:hypothetical protein [Steroidobacter agaridevorans]
MREMVQPGLRRHEREHQLSLDGAVWRAIAASTVRYLSQAHINEGEGTSSQALALVGFELHQFVAQHSPSGPSSIEHRRGGDVHQQRYRLPIDVEQRGKRLWMTRTIAPVC